MGILNRKRQATVVGREAAGETHPLLLQPAYDPDLIERLERQHGSLLALSDDIRRQTESCDFANLVENLQRFRRILREHILEENLRFYAYLTKYVALPPQDARLIREMRVEMTEIARRVNEFIEHYLKRGIDHDNIDEFERALSVVIGKVAGRFRREEETLYNRYMLPEHPQPLSF